jgi:alpha/beta superfamily hydrolase
MATLDRMTSTPSAPPTSASLLATHRRFEDELAGFSEEFLRPTLGGVRTVAVLTRPLGPVRPVGWVICHSLALEQVHLARLEVVAARALATAGFPVMRYHGRGYGDSQGGVGIGLATHLADANEAVDLMKDVGGVERIGMLGARFGGAVAALVADHLGLSLLGLWEPVTRGQQFMRDFLRTRLFAELTDHPQPGGPGGMERIRAEFETQGWADIQGFPLSREAHDEISRLDLAKDVTRFAGASLLVSVSRSGKPSSSSEKLAEHLRSLGGTCQLETVQDRTAPQLGQFHFQTVWGGRGKRDTQFALDRAVADATSHWSLSLPAVDPVAPSTAPPTSEEPEPTTRIREHPVFVPYREEHLAAVLCEPEGPPKAMVLLVTGIGAPRSHRFQVWAKVARRLAQEGYASVRMDYGGLGDSTGSLQELPLIDAPWQEAEAVARFAMRAVGTSRMAVAGNCLGATVALRIAAEMPECVASAGILTRLRDPGATYQVLHRARGWKLGQMLRSNRFVRRVLVRRIKGLKGKALPGVQDQLSRALARERMLFIYSEADDDVYSREVQAMLDQMLAKLPRERRDRFELRVIPEGPLARMESLSSQTKIIDTVSDWLVHTLGQLAG